jgi:hypothetical protein
MATGDRADSSEEPQIVGGWLRYAGHYKERLMWRGQFELLLDECIGLNASFAAIMGAWLTTSRGFVTMPVMQILNSTSIVTIAKYLSRRNTDK